MDELLQVNARLEAKVRLLEEKVKQAEIVLDGLRYQLGFVKPYSDIPSSNGLVGRINECLEILRGR